MEYEKDANFSNFTFDKEITPGSTMAFIAHEIIFTIFTIAGMCADVAIIYVLSRFQRLQKIENLYLIHWCLADFGFLLSAPSGYRILALVGDLSMSPEFMCSLFHIGQTFQVAAMLFVVTIIIDWFLAAYFQKTSEKFRMYYKFPLVLIWVFMIFINVITTVYCMNDVYSSVTVFLFIGLFFVILISVALLQLCSGIKKYCLHKPLEHPSFMLNLATAYPTTYILAFVTLVLTDSIGYHPLLAMIGEILLFGNSIVSLALLYNCNKDFQACFVQALKRGNKYEESISSFDNPLANKVYDQCSVPIQISFRDGAELINT